MSTGGTHALLTPAERADLEMQATVLARLRAEVDEAIVRAVLEPGVWNSPARDACAVRVDELRAALRTVHAALDDAGELVRVRLAGGDVLDAYGAG
ncbi:hypothetical protein ASF62_15970 [Leifsonia sp. Leaf325]|nr:hypothetical protein [Leifsonia sp. Leaf325]KQQ93218.1 hypothetical protein ASF62_15970 [Leifsonia sp. Leaf325]